MLPPLTSQAELEIAELVSTGRKIEAIKRYRELTGMGLKEAKEAVEALETDLLLRKNQALVNQTEASIARFLFAGQKIEAIKRYREITGQGLKESKDMVEAMEADLRKRAPGKFSAPAVVAKGCLGMLAVLAVAGLAIALAWRAAI